MFALIAYLSCIALWVGSLVRMVRKKKPLLALLLLGLHSFELLTIGFKTGKEYGKKTGTTILCTLLFGFFWWLPLRRQMKEETFTDDDFIRRPDDIVIRHD